ncbi:MAG: UDP-N-acetylmuramoyl-L-alanyl-D-glutamate--2,6-diaminopimelate ligase [Ruminococcaceae bacterium]|nr:UDP-N-acetylmuramoyl-L-alanyl-D-glutamate--2,6-diaminopimelate ligase [Oscillospiraceae bacterium]
MKLSELLKNVDVEEIIGNGELNISGITFDSRQVKPGYLFICIPGFKVDGHDFASDAIEKGAVAILAEHSVEGVCATTVIVKNARRETSTIASNFYDHPDKKLKLIGITGTNGKTTTTYLIKSIIENTGKVVGLIGTNQNIIGKTVIPSHHTTPDFIELMELLSQMKEEGAEYVVMEVSSHSLALDRVAACQFEVGAFTNITQDHLDFHETMENYLEAKSKLFSLCKTGVINNDSDAANYLIDKAKNCHIMTYGINNQSEIMAKNVNLRGSGIDFDLVIGDEKVRIDLAIPGEFSVYNALTAISCCVRLGFSLAEIAEGLKVADGVKGRVEVVRTNTNYTVIIDYAHTPDGLLNIINTIRGFAKARVITVFGCGGDRDKAKRPLMGKIAGELSDFCVVTSDNPRSENPSDIIADILAGISGTGCNYAVVENRFDAIEFALDHAEKDDIILLAGKGHETYQILKDRTIVFDEREIVLKLVENNEA